MECGDSSPLYFAALAALFLRRSESGDKSPHSKARPVIAHCYLGAQLREVWLVEELERGDKLPP